MADRIDLQMAQRSFEAIGRHIGSSFAGELRSRARSLPSMLRTSGVAVTLSFLEAKAKGREGDGVLLQAVHSELARFVPAGGKSVVAFLQTCATHDAATTARVTHIAVLAADHLKRAAEVLLPKPEDSEPQAEA